MRKWVVRKIEHLDAMPTLCYNQRGQIEHVRYDDHFWSFSPFGVIWVRSRLLLTTDCSRCPRKKWSGWRREHQLLPDARMNTAMVAGP